MYHQPGNWELWILTATSCPNGFMWKIMEKVKGQKVKSDSFLLFLKCKSVRFDASASELLPWPPTPLVY